MDHSKTASKLSLKQRAYREISDWLVKGILKPGQPLVETELAERLNISRTPIREALGQLEKEGLIESYPRKGSFVTRLTLREIQELFEIREALEGMAARLSATRISDSAIEALAEKFRKAEAASSEPESDRLCEDAGDSLHATILESCGNPSITRIIENFKTRLNRERNLAAKIPGRIKSAYQDHLGIYEALRERDPEKAERIMRKHIGDTKKSLLETVR